MTFTTTNKTGRNPQMHYKRCMTNNCFVFFCEDFQFQFSSDIFEWNEHLTTKTRVCISCIKNIAGDFTVGVPDVKFQKILL